MNNRLQEKRWEKGWSQGQLSIRSGVGQSTIARIENHEMNPTIDVVWKLCKALGVDVWDLFIPPE